MAGQKASAPYLFIALIFSGILVLLAGGYFTFRTLSSVVRMLHEETARSEGTSYIKEISNSLEEARNNVRLYGLTGNKVYFNRYGESMDMAKSNLLNLERQYREDTLFSERIGTLHILMDSVNLLWEQMIFIWQMDETSEELNQLKEEYLKNEIDSTEKIRLIDRILRQKREEEQTRKEEARKEEVIARINEIEAGERQNEQKIIAKEKELATSGTSINESLMELMGRMEDYEVEVEQARYQSADRLTRKTYIILGLFSILGSLFSILAFVLIIQYVRKNRAYSRVLIQSRQEAEELARAKELFMANVSHEIRTPLHAISGFIKQMLRTGAEDKFKEQLRIIDTASDQLIRLINDVLDFTKLQSGKLTLHSTHFDPGEIVNRVCTLFMDQAANQGSKLSSRIENGKELVLFGDEHRFQQILYNLLSNAVKFTRNGKIDVILNVEGGEDKKAVLELVVKDTGTGIEASRLKEIFNEYTQEDQNTSIIYGGTGLGLTIVKNLVELFEGKIQVKSRKGEGTTVKCLLQFENGNRQEIPERLEEPDLFSLPEGTRFLVVDDEAYNRSLVSAILKKWNVTFDIARNGLEAIEMLKQNTYGFVLMDIRMPVIDGISATRFIRETLGFSREQLPVIGVTADIKRNEKDRSLEMFNAILVKPFSETDLIRTLEAEKGGGTDRPFPQDEKENEPKTEVDLRNLIRIAGGDMQFVKEMIAQFELSAEKGLKTMREALENYDPEKLSDAAHSIVPASRHLGLTELVSLLKEIEEGTENKETDKLRKLVDRAEHLFSSAVESCNAHLEELNGR